MKKILPPDIIRLTEYAVLYKCSTRMAEMLMDIRQKIDELRKQKGWSRSKLAKEAGLAFESKYERTIHRTILQY